MPATMPNKLDPKTPTERVPLVMAASLLARIDEWRRRQPKIPNRSDAIRQLVDERLKDSDI